MLTNHDRRMIVTLIVAIAAAVVMAANPFVPLFLGPLQLLVCSIALYFKLKKL